MSWFSRPAETLALLQPVLPRLPISPRLPWVDGSLAPGVERRVRVADYDRLRGRDPRLVPLPAELCAPGRAIRMHWAAVEATILLLKEARSMGFAATVCSGWRRHAWKSRAHYEQAMIAKYGSLAQGQKYRAYDSPHETGLAIDLLGSGLAPRSKTIASQRRSAVYAWLMSHAHRFGWSPYLAEPWHWELAVPREIFDSGPRSA